MSELKWIVGHSIGVQRIGELVVVGKTITVNKKSSVIIEERNVKLTCIKNWACL